MTATVAELLDAATRTVRVLRFPPDPAERESAANWAAFEVWCQGGDRRLAATVARRRCVDAVRRETGRYGARPAIVPVQEFPDVPTETRFDDELDLVDLVGELAETPREAIVLARVAAGWRKDAIAASLGVTPGRVSHILAAVRARQVAA